MSKPQIHFLFFSRKNLSLRRKMFLISILSALVYLIQNGFSAPAWGGLSSAIPGEIRGYWELHRRFGRLPWQSLFQPAITLCRQGIPVSRITAEMLIKMRNLIMHSPSLKLIGLPFIWKIACSFYRDTKVLIEFQRDFLRPKDCRRLQVR